MQASYLPSARSEGNTVYNLADEPAEQQAVILYIGQYSFAPLLIQT